MDPELLRAHRTLDAAVDKAFGLKGAVDEYGRLRALFAAYASPASGANPARLSVAVR